MRPTLTKVLLSITKIYSKENRNKRKTNKLLQLKKLKERENRRISRYDPPKVIEILL